MHGFHIFSFMSNGLKALNWCCLKFKCNINCILKSKNDLHIENIHHVVFCFLTILVSLTFYKTKNLEVTFMSATLIILLTVITKQSRFLDN